MSKTLYQITGVLTMTLSFLSIMGASYIIHTAYQKRKDKQNRDFIVNDYVFYMSFCDLIAAIQVLLYWSAIAFDSSWMASWPHGLCWISGFIFQFVLVGSATWNFFIAINLVRLMAFQASPLDLKYESDHTICGNIVKWNHVIVWTVALIASLIPVTAYGFTTNAEAKAGFDQYECWIDNTNYQLCLYLLIFIYVGITICILFWILLGKFGIVNSSSYGTEFIENRLAAYSLLFVIVWIFPLIARCYGFAGIETPTFFVVMHHLLLASVGIGNCFIWTCFSAQDIDGMEESDDDDDREDEEEESDGEQQFLRETNRKQTEQNTT